MAIRLRLLQFSATLALLSAIGCSSPEPAPLNVWRTADDPLVVDPGATEGFAGLVAVADRVLDERPEDVRRTRFTEDRRRTTLASLAPALDAVELALRGGAAMDHRVRPTFEIDERQAAWALIGHALSWRVADAASQGDYEACVSWALVGLRYGLVFTGGDVLDATLGWTVLDQVRTAVTPALPDMSAEQLSRLSDGVEEALAQAPPVSRMVAAERDNYRMAVQTVQDATVAGELDALKERLGRTVEDSLDRVDGLDSGERPTFFAGLAAEAEFEAETLGTRLAMPAAQRDPDWPESEASRTIRDLAFHLFRTGRDIEATRDLVLAQVRLLAANAHVLSVVRTSGQPPELADLPDGEIFRDPYNDRPFAYRRAGSAFRLHSVGPNLRDDGGASDLAGHAPDVILPELIGL